MKCSLVSSTALYVLLVIQLTTNILAVSVNSPLQQQYIVQLSTEQDAIRLASHLNLSLIGKVGELSDFFVLEDRPVIGSNHLRHVDTIKQAATSFILLLPLNNHQHTQRAMSASSVDIEPLVSRQTLFKRSIPSRGSNSRDLNIISAYYNDPQVKNQWHLSNLVNVNHDIDIVSVWAANHSGQGVTVSVVDDGIDYTHPDLHNTFYAAGSYDFINKTNLPTPTAEDAHGTKCAGLIAAQPNNNVCGVGVSYGVQVSGIRILGGTLTVADEAAALNFDYQNNDIYSCSWGPSDDGDVVDGPSRVTLAAFKNGVSKGRNGLGNVYVFASGNGGANNDNCNYDGFTNSIYVMAVGAINKNDISTWYAERCTALLVVTYGGDSSGTITTSDLNSGCTSTFVGTSAAAPIVSGVVALLLSVRPDLTWRDVHNIIRLTAVPINLVKSASNWARLPNGLYYSDWFGYGKLNASAAVNRAQTNYNLLAPPLNITIPSLLSNQSSSGMAVYDGSSVSHSFIVASGSVNVTLEKVTVTVWIAHQQRGDLRVVLTSPANIQSVLATPRPKDLSTVGLMGWTFSSLKHWDEDPIGAWTLTVYDDVTNGYTGLLYDWEMTFWGGNKSYPTIPNVIFPISGNSSTDGDTESAVDISTQQGTYIVIGGSISIAVVAATAFGAQRYRRRKGDMLLVAS